MIDWATRARFLDLACRVQGLYQPDKLDVRQSGDDPPPWVAGVSAEEALRMINDPEAHDLAMRLNKIALGRPREPAPVKQEALGLPRIDDKD